MQEHHRERSSARGSFRPGTPAAPVSNGETPPWRARQHRAVDPECTARKNTPRQSGVCNMISCCSGCVNHIRILRSACVVHLPCSSKLELAKSVSQPFLLWGCSSQTRMSASATACLGPPGFTVSRLLSPGRNACCTGHTPLRVPNSYPGGLSTTVRRNRPSIPLAAGAAFRRRGPSFARRVSAQKRLGHSPPGPAPTASGRTGWSRSRCQANLAPVGTRPVSENRHSAISSLRASATIITRRMRPRAPAVRCSNHLLSTLSG